MYSRPGVVVFIVWLVGRPAMYLSNTRLISAGGFAHSHPNLCCSLDTGSPRVHAISQARKRGGKLVRLPSQPYPVIYLSIYPRTQ
ncbi:hypothetical protein F4779DRAFT_589646 [Xylariaceae sp. FL0662B]|nr:hypothetical protein F4779DRAFT_589646 [Xylariaceae sp. FL0662B]